MSVGAMLAVGAGAAVAATNPVVGTWEMSAAKSTIDAKGAPRSETFTFANSDKGVTLTSNVTAADGKQSTHTSDPSLWDGVSHPVTDSADHDAVMAKSVGAGLFRYSFTKAGAVVNSGTLAVSKDGTVLTIAGSRTSAKGGKSYYNIVFDKK
jgi:hypothetical protein